jgi:hypothetical protein
MISVVIIAFQKRPFLVDAIKSVLSQDLESQNFEIVLIKNFVDKLDFLPNNVKVIDAIDDISIGSKLIKAAKNLKGNYISILEDDDIFLPGKLKMIFHLLNSNTDIVYVNNGYLKIYGDKTASEYSEVKIDFTKDVLMFNKNTLSCETYFRIRPDFNLSSITIKKQIILDNIKIIKGKTHVVDTLLFALALNSGYDMVKLKSKYTGYRIHENNLSLKESYFSDSSLTKRIIYMNSVISVSKDIYGIFQEKRIKKIFGFNYFTARIMLDLLKDSKRGKFYWNLIGLIKNFQFCQLKSRTDSFFYCSLSLLLPNVVHKFYVSKYYLIR